MKRPSPTDTRTQSTPAAHTQAPLDLRGKQTSMDKPSPHIINLNKRPGSSDFYEMLPMTYEETSQKAPSELVEKLERFEHQVAVKTTQLRRRNRALRRKLARRLTLFTANVRNDYFGFTRDKNYLWQGALIAATLALFVAIVTLAIMSLPVDGSSSTAKQPTTTNQQPNSKETKAADGPATLDPATPTATTPTTAQTTSANPATTTTAPGRGGSSGSWGTGTANPSGSGSTGTDAGTTGGSAPIITLPTVPILPVPTPEVPVDPLDVDKDVDPAIQPLIDPLSTLPGAPLDPLLDAVTTTL